MQLIGELSSIDNVRPKLSIEPVQSALMKSHDGLSRRKLLQASLMKRQEGSKDSGGQQHPKPGHMLGFANAKNSQQQRCDEDARADSHEHQISLRVLLDLIVNFAKSLFVRLARSGVGRVTLPGEISLLRGITLLCRLSLLCGGRRGIFRHEIRLHYSLKLSESVVRTVLQPATASSKV